MKTWSRISSGWMRLPGCKLMIWLNKSMNSTLPLQACPLKSKPFFKIDINYPSPVAPNNWFCLAIIFALSRPATPNRPTFMRVWPSSAMTRLLRLSQSGKPDSTSSKIEPSDQTSKMKLTCAKSVTRTFAWFVKRLERNEWISGGRYSGVDWTNSHWFLKVLPSWLSRNEEPRSIIFSVRIDCVL